MDRNWGVMTGGGGQSNPAAAYRAGGWQGQDLNQLFQNRQPMNNGSMGLHIPQVRISISSRNCDGHCTCSGCAEVLGLGFWGFPHPTRNPAQVSMQGGLDLARLSANPTGMLGAGAANISQAQWRPGVSAELMGAADWASQLNPQAMFRLPQMAQQQMAQQQLAAAHHQQQLQAQRLQQQQQSEPQASRSATAHPCRVQSNPKVVGSACLYPNVSCHPAKNASRSAGLRRILVAAQETWRAS